MRRMTRRGMAGLALAGLAAKPALAALGDPADYTAKTHMQARPRPLTGPFVPDDRAPGVRLLGLDRNRDAVLFTPKGLDYSKPIPLIVALHWFAGTAWDGLSWFKPAASERKFLLLSPPSRRQTWDMDAGPTGPDAAFIDRAVDWVFQRFPIDPTHLAISGMSDGGSYALSMGLQNGDLFTDVLSFSPIRFSAPDAVGRPRFFFSSGRDDDMAPISNVQRLVGELRGLGYDVELDVHPKGHVLTDEGVSLALKRFLG